MLTSRQQHSAGSLADHAYLLIRHKILKGEFPLGMPLSRRKLAVEFRMSFVPISEAIQRLESEGLVESRPRVGTRVRVPTAQDFRDRYIIREALETQSARLFCEKASAAEREEVRGMAKRLDEMTRKWARGDHDPDFLFSVQVQHLSLHMRIAECAGCALLCDLLENTQVLTFNWLYDVAAGYRLPPSSHLPLVEVLTGSDPDAADAAMRSHVRKGMQEIQAALTETLGEPVSILQRVPAIGEAGGSGDSLRLWRARYRRNGPVAPERSKGKRRGAVG